MIDQLWIEAADLLSEDGENPEYDRAIVELTIRMTPGLAMDLRPVVESILRRMKGAVR